MSIDESDHGDDDLVVTEDEAPGPVASGATSDPAVAPRPRAKLIALASGRGGTGRSLLAANIAV